MIFICPPSLPSKRRPRPPLEIVKGLRRAIAEQKAIEPRTYEIALGIQRGERLLAECLEEMRPRIVETEQETHHPRS